MMKYVRFNSDIRAKMSQEKQIYVLFGEATLTHKNNMLFYLDLMQNSQQGSTWISFTDKNKKVL